MSPKELVLKYPQLKAQFAITAEKAKVDAGVYANSKDYLILRGFYDYFLFRHNLLVTPFYNGYHISSVDKSDLVHIDENKFIFAKDDTDIVKGHKIGLTDWFDDPISMVIHNYYKGVEHAINYLISNKKI